ncbi:hypothetical protein V6Z11_D11G158200 [Gossypium hirsutum]
MDIGFFFLDLQTFPTAVGFSQIIFLFNPRGLILTLIHLRLNIESEAFGNGKSAIVGLSVSCLNICCTLTN